VKEGKSLNFRKDIKAEAIFEFSRKVIFSSEKLEGKIYFHKRQQENSK